MVMKKKGMWEGKSGLSAGAKFNQRARDIFENHLQAEIHRLIETLREVEEALDQAGAILSISQPPMEGKLSLRWWYISGAYRYREPVIVRWEWQGNGVMTPRRMVRPKALSSNNFAINHKETDACLQIIKGLLKLRSQTKARLDSIRKTTQGNASAYLQNEIVKLDILRQRVLQNLVERGYDVEARILNGEDGDRADFADHE